MNLGKSGLWVGIAVLLSLSLWASGALAFCPPCQPVTAWKEGTFPDQTVHYKVFDSRQDADVEGASPQPAEVYGLYAPQGLVFWTAKVSSLGAVSCRVYDPGRSAWQADDWIAPDYFVPIPEGADGAIAWLASGGPGATKCILRTYDPGPGVWKGGELFSDYPDHVDLFVRDGVVAWYLRNFTAPYRAHLLFAVYDPGRAEWRTGQAIIPLEEGEVPPSLLISEATVIFGDYRFGYDAASGGWLSGLNTQPLARVVAQPTRGKAPLWVWFTDMSIGPLSWSRSWTFGDGGSSTLVSPSHTYGHAGKFTVMQQVNGVSWFSREVAVNRGSFTSAPALLLLQ